jgi:hypothetical protein
MTGTYEKILERLKRLEREVERLKVKESPGAWLDWTPTQTGWTALPLGVYRYCRVGKLVIAIIYMADGSSNATNAVLSLPIQAAAYLYVNGFIGAADSGMNLSPPGFWTIEGGATEINFYKDATGANWTASGTKLVNGVIIYEAA